jgi:hypothetical protein
VEGEVVGRTIERQYKERHWKKAIDLKIKSDDLASTVPLEVLTV